MASNNKLDNKLNSNMLYKTIRVKAHPSLALLKYWGKSSNTLVPNIPATTSIAITLDTLESELIIEQSKNIETEFILDGKNKNPEIIFELLNYISHIAPRSTHKMSKDLKLKIIAKNNFPSSSGLASSSSGFAALALGLSKFFNIDLDLKSLSKLSRIGSGSASRSIFGGFTIWRKNMEYAQEIESNKHWPDLRIIVLAPYLEEKIIGSREAMNRTSQSSPYYKSWIKINEGLVNEMIRAIRDCNIEKLGDLTRKSYLAMHASSFVANPEIIYLKPKSLMIIELVSQLRKRGIGVWETMDAGPQLKLLCLEKDLTKIIHSIQDMMPDLWLRVCSVGQGAQIVN